MFHFLHVEAVEHIEHVVATGIRFLIFISHELARHHHHLIVEEFAETFAQVFLHASLQFLAFEALEEGHGLVEILHQISVFLFGKAHLRRTTTVKTSFHRFAR